MHCANHTMIIEELRELVASKKLTNFDEAFVKQFLVNGSVSLPKESMLLPTESIKDLFGTLQANKTYCFSTHPGPFGWCATCDLNAKELEKGHCSKKHPKKSRGTNGTYTIKGMGILPS